jgi:hypothetical protein
MEPQKDLIGKKIVFVHPPDLVSKHLMGILTEMEYEVYSSLDHSKIKRMNSVYPGTLFFINIDTAMNGKEWETFITDLRSSQADIQLGVLSFKITEPDKIQYYLMDLGVNCGFIQLKQGVAAASEMMLKILHANEVKGRRKYLRYECLPEEASLNFKVDDKQFNGSIQDISSVGISFSLAGLSGLVKNQLLKDIQLRLKGLLVNTNGVIFGQRVVEGRTLYVLLFKSPEMQRVRTRVHSYISSSMQRTFDREIE